MATIRYEITDGILPFSVILREGVSLIDINFHVSTGQYYFTEVPDGNYTITVIDAAGCKTAFNVFVNCITTTVLEPTTTINIEQQELISALNSSYIDDDILPLTIPSSGINGNQGIAEDNNYIFLAFADSYEVDYRHTILYRYNKTTKAFDYKRVTASQYSEYHKTPYIYVTRTGALIMTVEQLIANGAHNGPVSVFRWADPSDLDTYSTTVIGNNSTERLAYPQISEVNNKLIIDCRRYATYRVCYESTDDGLTFGTMNEYLNYGDSDYWSYARLVQNQGKNNTRQIITYLPLVNTSINAYQYGTPISTDFTNFYALDGTNLGTSLTKAEIEDNISYGDIIKNSNNYFSYSPKIICDDIYFFVSIGVGNWTVGSNYTHVQIFKTNLTTGITISGDLITNPIPEQARGRLVVLSGKLYYKVILPNAGSINYYRISDDLNDVYLVYSESENWNMQQFSDKNSELMAEYNNFTNEVRIYRGENPTINGCTTTTTTTTTSEQPTTSEEPTTTAELTTTIEPTTTEEVTTTEELTTTEQPTTTEEITTTSGGG